MDSRSRQYDPSDPQRYGPDYLPWQGYAPTALLERPLGEGWGDALPPPPATPAPTGGPPPGGHRRRRWVVALVAALALVLAALGAGFAAQHRTSPQSTAATQQSPGTTQQNPGTTDPGTSPGQGGQGTLPTIPGLPGQQGGTGTQDQQKSSASSAEGKAAAAAISPALVNITTTVSYGQGEAAGTGIVLTADGVVLTNHHVVEGATKIQAYDVGNGTTYTADVVGYDSTHDVAVLQLEGASGLQTATIDQDGVSVGDGVVGVGNAGGLGGTPSAAEGQVTALGSDITVQSDSGGTAERLTGLIQTDAGIEPGDSGGALVDLQGEVIGVDTAASSNNSTGRGQPQGYAIPIASALSISDQIRSGTASSTVHIGDTAFLGVQLAPDVTGRVVVGDVVSGSAAAGLGLGAGDVITAVDGTRVRSAATLSSLIKSSAVGASVTVTWRDGATGQSEQATTTLQAGPVG